MRYINNKTGAIIDSPFKILGNTWEVMEAEEATEVEQEELDQVDEEEEEFVEEEIDLEDMTNKQLEELAEKENIELSSADKKNKDTRIAAIVKAFE